MRNGIKVAVGLGISLALMAALAMPAAAADQAAFPKPAQYVLHSHPHFIVTVGDNKETVICDAELVLQTGEPYVAANGKRHVDLKVVSWKASGSSKLLGGPLNFRMLQNMAASDKSFVESYEVFDAKRGSQDFPARAQFAVPYELDTPFGTVTHLYGVTAGTIESFPPQPGSQFKMQKGDVAHLMAELMPAPLSSLSAAGDVQAVGATIEPDACYDADSSGGQPVRR
jgi:hypothetical protein